LIFEGTRKSSWGLAEIGNGGRRRSLLAKLARSAGACPKKGKQKTRPRRNTAGRV